MQLLSLARFYNLGLAAVVTSLNAYDSEAECICKCFMFGPEEGRRGNKCFIFFQEALLGLSPWLRQGVAHCQFSSRLAEEGTLQWETTEYRGEEAKGDVA